MATTLERIRAQGWFGPLARTPMLAWRMGLAPVVGHTFMVLTTRGRKSGQPRHTMVAYRTIEGRRYAFAVYGAQTDWLRNIEADPHVTVQTAHGMEPSTARRLSDPEDLGHLFDLLRREEPAALRAYLASRGLPFDRSAFTGGDESVIAVTFEPTMEPCPPPLDADLRWLWAVLPAAVISGLARRTRRP